MNDAMLTVHGTVHWWWCTSGAYYGALLSGESDGTSAVRHDITPILFQAQLFSQPFLISLMKVKIDDAASSEWEAKAR